MPKRILPTTTRGKHTLWLLIALAGLGLVLGSRPQQAPVRAEAPPLAPRPPASPGGMQSPLPTSEPCPACWTYRAPYPLPIAGAAWVALGGQVYSFGGRFTAGYAVTNAYVYDPDADRWMRLADLPEALHSASAVTDGTTIYLVSGIACYSEEPTIFRYDPPSNTYTRLASAPADVTGYPAAAYLNGQIYRIGGGTSQVQRYTIATNTWDPPGTVADYPLPTIEGLTAVAASGYIYAGGGVSNYYDETNKTYRYDPASNTWDDAAVADLPFASAYVTSASLQRQWVLVDGSNGIRVLALNLGQPSSDWISLPAPPVAHEGDAAASVDSRLYLLGGDVGQQMQDTLQYRDVRGSATPAPTGTPPTSTVTRTPRPTATPLPTGTPCTSRFSDVGPRDYFYTPVQYLACHGVLSGYADATFRPYAFATRSQLVKIVVLSYALPIRPPACDIVAFVDVPPTHPFYAVIGTAAALGIVAGYTCGGPGEPCDWIHRPYFRPAAGVTRGQLSKIVVGAAGWPLQTSGGPHFTDVPPGSPFYPYVETAYNRGVVSGYGDGAFRGGAPATRGQMAKIVAHALQP